MAIRPHEYDEENAEGIYDGGTLTNTATTGANAAQILGSALAANTKYLIVARALFKPSNTGAVGEIRVQTDDDSDIESKSLMLVEPQQSATTDMISYLFPHSYTTASSPSDVEFQLSDGGAAGDIRIRVSSLFVLDLDAISASNLLGTHYFDASDAGPTDSGADWDNDSNAFDGSISTFAVKNGTGGGSLTAEGTTAPTSGAAIGAVVLKVTIEDFTAGGAFSVDVDEDSVGGTELLGLQVTDAKEAKEEVRGLVAAPASGWTWQKVNDLAISFNAGSDIDTRVYLAEVLVYDANGLGYFEDAQDVSGDDFSKTADTTVVASLAGSDLGTDEHLILGYGRCDIANTGRYFDISLHAAYDTSTSTVRSQHRAEGEDVNEQRIVGFALRHKASSGTPDVTMFGASENAGGGQNADGGGYLIALPTALFADFEDDFTSGFINVDGTETTVATSGSYTPTVTGNHLIIGRTNGSAGPTALGRMWVDSTTTEIRTGDEPPSHNQIWDNTKDLEMMATFQRYSITTAETFNLQVQGAASNFGVAFRWLIVVNLNKPATGPTVYPPFPQRQRRAVRM